MKKTKILIPVLFFIIAAFIAYPKLPHITFIYKISWLFGSILMGIVLPFLIYTYSFTNKTIYSDESQFDDNRYIKPKSLSLFFGIIFIAIGLGLLFRNSLDLITISFIFIGVGAVIGVFLFPSKNTFGNKS